MDLSTLSQLRGRLRDMKSDYDLQGENGRDRSLDRGREPRSIRPSPNRVYVANIPYEFRWQDLRDLFRTRVGDVSFVEMFVDDRDNPKGSAIVEFAEFLSVGKCLSVMKGYEVKAGQGSRQLVVRADEGNVRDKHGNIIRGSGGGGGGGGGGGMNRNMDNNFSSNNVGPMFSRGNENSWGNTYGLSIQFLQSLNIEPPLTTRVFVANLEYNVNEKKIKEVFRLAGRIVDIELSLDKDGKSRGFGIVEFDHPVEAVQAVSMFNGQFLNDRMMSVKLDRANEHLRLPDGLRAVGMGLGPNGEPLRNVSLNLCANSATTDVGGGGGILDSFESDPLELANALSGLSKLGALTNKTSALPALGRSLLGGSLSDIQSLASLVGRTAAQPPPPPFVPPQGAAGDRRRSFGGDNSRRLFGRGVGGGPGMGGAGLGDRSRFSDAGL